MKLKSIKKVLYMVMLLTTLFTVTVLADEEFTLLPEGQSVSYKMEGIEPRGYLIASSVASIANNEDGTLSLFGQIITHTTLEYASITLYLERYEPELDDWIYISDNDTEFTLEKDGEAMMGAPTVSFTVEGGGIEPGYYYRVKGSYIAKKEGRRETRTVTTDGVLLTKIK